MADFRINYVNVKNQTRSMSRQLSEFQAQINSLQALQAQIPSVWAGNVADTYMEKLNNLYRENEKHETTGAKHDRGNCSCS